MDTDAEIWFFWRAAGPGRRGFRGSRRRRPVALQGMGGGVKSFSAELRISKNVYEENKEDAIDKTKCLRELIGQQ